VKWIRVFCTVYPLGALALYLIHGGQPVAMVVFGGFFQGVTLPVIAGIAIYFRYRKIDRRLAPSATSDVFLWIAFLSITVVACYASWQQIAKFYQWITS
jgi:Mn2+/Fe2+ NRAMP family transporter